MHKEHKRETLEIIMTDLHSGGKFDDNSYKVSGGLHGVGVSVVNALSKRLEVEVRRDGKVWQQTYEQGRPVAPIKAVGTSKKTGTKVTFWPDPEIFSVTEFHFDSLSQRLRELSFLNPGVKISIHDERTDKKHDFAYEGGIRSFVEHLNKAKQPIHDKVIFFQDVKNGTGDPKRDADKERVEVALQWNEGYAETLFTFTNTINNRDGGTHLEGFKTALTRAIQKYAEQNGADEGPQGDEPLRRRLPRGADRGHLGQGQGSQVLLADQGQARLLRGQDVGPAGRLRQARLVPRGEPARRQEDRREDRRVGAGARGRAQGPRARAPQGRARLGRAAGQARRLPGEGPRLLRDLHRRGRLGRRLGQDGPRPPLPGDPAAARQDPERREGAAGQDARLGRDPHADHRARRRHLRRTSTPRRSATTRSSS